MSIQFRYSNNSYFKQSSRYLKNDKNDRESVIKLHILKSFYIVISDRRDFVYYRATDDTNNHQTFTIIFFFLDKVIFPCVSHVYLYQIIVAIVYD